MNIYEVMPLTIVFDYLKDDIGDRVETFLNIYKMIDRNLEHDYETINQKLQEN